MIDQFAFLIACCLIHDFAIVGLLRLENKESNNILIHNMLGEKFIRYNFPTEVLNVSDELVVGSAGSCSAVTVCRGRILVPACLVRTPTLIR